jgi:hypothetical protein
MRANGYTILALGQHLDDVAESFLMSVFRNGVMRTMKANYAVEQGDLRVIRPLTYVRERTTEQLAREFQVPIISDNCPACFATPKERHRIKLLLSQQEGEWPQLFPSLQRALAPLLAISTTDRAGDGLVFATGEEEAAEEAMAGPCASGACAPATRRKSGKSEAPASHSDTAGADKVAEASAANAGRRAENDEDQGAAMRGKITTHAVALLVGLALGRAIFKT